MKVKTSITLSEELMRSIDEAAGDRINRSQFIEEAVKEYIVQRARKKREFDDLAILNKKADKLNKEAADVLSYQVDL
jgi:metal-responsive CopG/Arc/MetJ family transcriptional regulator